MKFSMAAAILLFSGQLVASGKPVNAETWKLRLSSDASSVVVNTDGSQQQEIPFVPAAKRELSPDGTKLLLVEQGYDYTLIKIADASGANAKPLTEKTLYAQSPCWSPDGKRIAFSSNRQRGVAAGLDDGSKQQVYVMDPDGGNVKQISDEGVEGVVPQFSSDGRLAYLARPKARAGKLQLSDLTVYDAGVNKAVVKDAYIGAYEWSPDGKTIAYSTYFDNNALVFHELATGKETIVKNADIDPRLKSHCAWNFAWRADGEAIACSMGFVGGRVVGSPAMFGDNEVFVIPRTGAATWFTPRQKPMRIEWVSSK
jgi:Tol biopolymer transport system component